MTDKQIRQNAEYFATHLNGEITPFSSREYEAYVAGAHSRDEEVKEWIESKGKLRRKLMHIIYDLRHPWISVEDRLPEKTKGVFSCQVRQREKDKIVYYKDTRGYIHTGYLNANNHWRDLDGDNGAIYQVTHWMPIPQTEKGE